MPMLNSSIEAQSVLQCEDIISIMQLFLCLPRWQPNSVGVKPFRPFDHLPPSAHELHLLLFKHVCRNHTSANACVRACGCKWERWDLLRECGCWHLKRKRVWECVLVPDYVWVCVRMKVCERVQISTKGHSFHTSTKRLYPIVLS